MILSLILALRYWVKYDRHFLSILPHSVVCHVLFFLWNAPEIYPFPAPFHYQLRKSGAFCLLSRYLHYTPKLFLRLPCLSTLSSWLAFWSPALNGRQEHGAVNEMLASLSIVTAVELSFTDWNVFTASPGRYLWLWPEDSQFCLSRIRSIGTFYSHTRFYKISSCVKQQTCFTSAR